jgi:SAM-dependent methyltransferase
MPDPGVAGHGPEPGLRVQIGTGSAPIEGWINTQKSEVDLTRRLPFADASCEAVTISHVLMYLDVYEMSFALRELRRALRPGGTLRLAEPDAKKVLTRAMAGELPKLHDTETVIHEGTRLEIGPGRCWEMQLFRYLMWSRHSSGLIAKSWLTYEILAELLADAGFTRIVRQSAATTSFAEAAICVPKLHGGDALCVYVEASWREATEPAGGITPGG